MSRKLDLLTKESLPDRLPDLVGRKLNVVLRDGRTRHGKLLSFDGGVLLLHDLLQKKHVISLLSVEEAVVEA